MSAHKASIAWRRSSESFEYEAYNRSHEWQFGAVTVPASAAPGYRGDAGRVDPEEAFVASIASCHMLTFLAIASRKGFTVDAYSDDATGILSKNAAGRLAINRVTLRPQIEFGGAKKPDEAAIARMHKRAHEECFIASSVKTVIVVEP